MHTRWVERRFNVLKNHHQRYLYGGLQSPQQSVGLEGPLLLAIDSLPVYGNRPDGGLDVFISQLSCSSDKGVKYIGPIAQFDYLRVF